MKPLRLQIRLYGDPCLRRKSEPLKEISVSERILIESMLRTMYETDGIGLAAPQVGINKQLFVADMGDGPVVVINPKVLKKQGACFSEEGCLSFPGISVRIKRPKTVEVEYTDENNQKVRRNFSDLMARIFLHENDHLEAKMIVDHIKPKEKEALQEKLTEIKKQSKGE